MNRSILKAKDRATAQQIRYVKTVARVQAKCKHEHLAECEYKPLNYLDPLPPMRICLDCGMTEEGWGVGYVVLKEDAPVAILREDLYRLRHGFVLRQDGEDHGDLLRGTTTVGELLSKWVREQERTAQ